MNAALLTTAQAASQARRLPATIRKWVQRGHLTPTSRDTHGRPLFSVDDVWAAEKRARERDRTPKSAQAVAKR